MHNNLFLRRLKIISNSGNIAYDENFHKGVNIIRGDNSSGKSTISHFIFYALGGAFSDWTDEAKLCSTVFCEIEVNGAVIVLKRYVSEGSANPMFIYMGSMDDLSKVTTEAQWQKFPYKTTENKRSFSNILFEYLKIPIVYGESNITMHQILRLLYIDQDSPTNSLFFYEQFDTGLTRETIAELLLGVYDENLYKDRISKREKTKKLESLQTEINGIKKFHSDKRELNPDYIRNLIIRAEQNKEEIAIKITSLKDKQTKVVYTKNSELNFQKLSRRAINQRREVRKLENEISKLNYEIDDSNYFIETLENKKDALSKSISTRQFIDSLPFRYCPECLSQLAPPQDNHCSLCKQKIDDEKNPLIAQRMAQEISFQILESKKIRDSRNNKLIEFKSALETSKVELTRLQRDINISLNDIQSFRDEKIDSLLIEKGEIDGLIIQYQTMLETAEKYNLLIDEMHSTEKEIDKLKDSIYALELNQKYLKKLIESKIEDIAIKLLHNDLNREEGFREATNLKINYYDNSIYVDDEKKKFSASSMFYLKNVARFAIFFASMEIPEMRFPRFILCDNMEDNGIEEERAQNFQNLIISTANNYNKKDFQIIYTTSYITEELNKSDYIVGKYYSEDNGKTLDV